MTEFIQALAAAGVAPFTVLLIAAILYWLLVILGALDLDLLHVTHDHEGAAHGHDGHDGDSHPGMFSGLLEFLSVGKVPLTIIASIFVFTGWSVAMASELILPLWWGLDLLLAAVLAVPVTGAACRPLRLVFASLDRGVAMGVSLLGREARITSATCDDRFGTATCTVDDAEMLLRVVATRPDLRFVRDDIVVIADHDAERDCYRVGPATYRASEPANLVADPQDAPAPAPAPMLANEPAHAPEPASPASAPRPRQIQ